MAAALLQSLRDRGFALRIETGRLVVAPGSRLTEADRKAIAECKAELLSLVGADQLEDDRRTWPPDQVDALRHPAGQLLVPLDAAPDSLPEALYRAHRTALAHCGWRPSGVLWSHLPPKSADVWRLLATAIDGRPRVLLPLVPQVEEDS